MFRTKIDLSKATSEQKHAFEMREFFQPKKARTIRMSSAFSRIGEDKAAKKLLECGSYLDFGHFTDDTNRLVNANFCKNRLCPMCSWRRSLKKYADLSDVFSVLENTHEFVFLTLTERNCTAEQLRDRMQHLKKAFRKWLRRQSLSVFDGCYMSLEITYNDKEDTYHPHLHIILCAPKGAYFGTAAYMPFEKWLSEWVEVGEYDYEPSIRVNKVANKTVYNQRTRKYVTISLKKALKEVAAYSVKDCDFFKNGMEQEQTDKAISVIYAALKNFRLFEFYGVMKDLNKHFKAEKHSDDDDLINITDKPTVKAEIEYHLVYVWSFVPEVNLYRYVLTSAPPELKQKIEKSITP